MALIYSTNGRCLFVNTKGGIIRSGRCDCLHHVLKLLIFFFFLFLLLKVSHHLHHSSWLSGASLLCQHPSVNLWWKTHRQENLHLSHHAPLRQLINFRAVGSFICIKDFRNETEICFRPSSTSNLF